MRLVWSQPTRLSPDSPRTVLLLSVLCIFLGGVVVGAGGRDVTSSPRTVRAAAASLLTTGGGLFVVGVVLLLTRKGRRSARPRLTLAEPSDESPAPTQKPRFGQEERL
jgi:hypothetical protein